MSGMIEKEIKQTVIIGKQFDELTVEEMQSTQGQGIEVRTVAVTVTITIFGKKCIK